MDGIRIGANGCAGFTRTSWRSDFPNPRVWRIRATFPASPIEPNPLQRIEIDVLETSCVDHVILGVRARTVERRYAAEAAEVVERPSSTKLVRRKSVLALEKVESIGRYHVMKVPLATADRAIAFANLAQVRSNLEPDAAAVT